MQVRRKLVVLVPDFLTPYFHCRGRKSALTCKFSWWGRKSAPPWSVRLKKRPQTLHGMPFRRQPPSPQPFPFPSLLAPRSPALPARRQTGFMPMIRGHRLLASESFERYWNVVGCLGRLKGLGLRPGADVRALRLFRRRLASHAASGLRVPSPSPERTRREGLSSSWTIGALDLWTFEALGIGPVPASDAALAEGMADWGAGRGRN